jgi:hypothetical protein
LLLTDDRKLLGDAVLCRLGLKPGRLGSIILASQFSALLRNRISHVVKRQGKATDFILAHDIGASRMVTARKSRDTGAQCLDGSAYSTQHHRLNYGYEEDDHQSEACEQTGLHPMALPQVA